MLNTYLQLCNYWRGLTTTVTGLNTVTIGSDEQAIDGQTQPGIKYPHLRVDTPDIYYPNDEGNFVEEYLYTIYVFSPDNTQRQEDNVLSDMGLLMRRIIAQLYEDSDADMFDIVLGGGKGEPIRKWSGDNCFGWTTQLRIRLYVNQC